jgi:hypothetical protein
MLSLSVASCIATAKARMATAEMRFQTIKEFLIKTVIFIGIRDPPRKK